MRLPSSVAVRDLLWAVALTAVTQLELVLASADLEQPLAQHLVFVPMTMAVALRRTAPLAAAGVVGVSMAAQSLAGPAPVVGGFIAMLVVLGSLGFHADLRRGLLGVALIAAGALVYDVTTDDFSAGDLIGNAAIVLMAWALAHALRRSNDARIAAELSRERAAQAAVHAERGRIARDLHDSVAHTLTVMTLQAGAARERTSEPVAAEALGSIETGGREALADMHRFLRLLDEGSPGQAPGLRDLDDLLARVRATGMEVQVDSCEGLESLPASVSATAYRVVQEGLTNAAKHSGSRAARVTLRRANGELVVRVTDRGPAGPTAGLPLGSGRGLASLRERLALFEGTITAAPDDDGWVLAVSIPLDLAR
jgi:signal transduction histidine kinase